MYASKENATKANESLEKAARLLDQAVPDKVVRDEIKRCLLHVQTFVEAAQNKLPREASFHKDRINKKS